MVSLVKRNNHMKLIVNFTFDYIDFVNIERVFTVQSG